MLNGKWIVSVTSLLVANMHTVEPAYAEPAVDPIASLLARIEGEQNGPIDISYGWVKLDGLPEEALDWTDVDAELLYAMKVSNQSARPVGPSDLQFMELLPEGLLLSTADYDGGGPIQTSFEFVSGDSGVILLPEDVSFSDDDGTSFDYQPSGSEFDEAIGAIRIKPRGIMAPNSSFVIRFRAHMR